MKALKNKHIITLLLCALFFSSCRTKKTFNGTGTLPCADYNVSTDKEGKVKKKTKWRLVLYKDGKKVGGKTKKGDSKLFQNEN